MSKINEILSTAAHRQFEFPEDKWVYYQEWNNALFLHWKVPFEQLRQLVPKELNLDSFDGDFYVSLVAFTMQRIRPKYLPSIKFISDFDEINIRTYIDNNNKKGVYFLNIEAGKELSVFIAKKLSGLPYEKSNIKRTNNNYQSHNTKKKFQLNVEFEIREKLIDKTELDKWITERYCLYVDIDDKIYRYDIHHKEWEIKNIELKNLNLNYKIGDITLTSNPVFKHYSNGVQVFSWKKIKVMNCC
jgi:uncharacterized protein YqjF (DUF2071 family)